MKFLKIFIECIWSAICYCFFVVTFIFILMLLTSACRAQDFPDSYRDFSDFSERWKFGKAKATPLTLQTKGYVRLILEPLDTSTYIYTITRVKKIWYDTTYQTTTYENTSVNINYSAGWQPGTNIPKFSGGNFHYGAAPIAIGVTRNAVFTITITRPSFIAFWSERFNTAPTPHGDYTIQLNNETPILYKAGNAPYNTDFLRGVPTWQSRLLPPGTHTVRIATAAQMVVDRFTVTAQILTPR